MPNNSYGEEENVLQAVVIADSFNERFMPLTLDSPRCLLPLLNIPIIEYTFEFLAISRVQEVILFCRAHADQIRQYVQKSRWSKATSTMNIIVVTIPECLSVGDALREIDARQMIHGDFFLVHGDVVSNVDLQKALAEHRQRRSKDKNMIMTMVLKKASPFHRTRERCESAIFAIDAATSECLVYQPLESESSCDKIELDSARLEGHSEVMVRYDLLDCQIDICSPQVLALFTENFDYQDVRSDFVRGVLQSDILGMRISTHVLRDEYAARVRTPHLYGAVSRDLMVRWAFPIVPEANILGEDSQALSFRRGYRYFGADVVLARSCEIGENVVLGHGVVVGEHSRIRNSVIGPRCRIGADVVLEGAYLWEGVTVEGGSRVFSSILADGVVVKSATIVEHGCLLMAGVVIGPKACLPQSTRVAKWSDQLVDAAMAAMSVGSYEDSPPVNVPLHILGSEADGVIWEGSTERDSDADEDGEAAKERLSAFTLGSSFHHTRPVYPDSEDSNSDFEEENNFDQHHFMKEAEEMVRHAINNNYSIDNAALEINGLKFACNATFPQCQAAIIAAIFSCIDTAAMAKSVAKVWEHWGPLLAKFTHGDSEQFDLLGTIRDYCTNNPIYERAFTHIVPIIYKVDIVDEDVVIDWYHKEAAQSTESYNSIYCRQIKGFVAWLEENSDDDESDNE